MSQLSRAVQKGAENIGGNPSLKSRRFEIQSKDFTQVEQGVPIRVVYGITETAGVQMTPIFGFRSKAVTTEAGK